MCSYLSVPPVTYKEKTDFCGMCVKMIALGITQTSTFLFPTLCNNNTHNTTSTQVQDPGICAVTDF